MRHDTDILILDELIAALDRRLPQLQRGTEAGIARDAAALRAKAQARIAELEHDTPPEEPE